MTLCDPSLTVHLSIPMLARREPHAHPGGGGIDLAQGGVQGVARSAYGVVVRFDWELGPRSQPLSREERGWERGLFSSFAMFMRYFLMILNQRCYSIGGEQTAWYDAIDAGTAQRRRAARLLPSLVGEGRGVRSDGAATDGLCSSRARRQ